MIGLISSKIFVVAIACALLSTGVKPLDEKTCKTVRAAWKTPAAKESVTPTRTRLKALTLLATLEKERISESSYEQLSKCVSFGEDPAAMAHYLSKFMEENTDTLRQLWPDGPAVYTNAAQSGAANANDLIVKLVKIDIGDIYPPAIQERDVPPSFLMVAVVIYHIAGAKAHATPLEISLIRSFLTGVYQA